MRARALYCLRWADEIVDSFRDNLSRVTDLALKNLKFDNKLASKVLQNNSNDWDKMKSIVRKYERYLTDYDYPCTDAITCPIDRNYSLFLLIKSNGQSDADYLTGKFCSINLGERYNDIASD
jgi:hypothetical protein